MKKKILVFTILALMVCAATLTSNVYACPGKKDGHHKWNLKKKFFKKAHFILDSQVGLDLTDKQVAKVKDLKITAKKHLIMKKAEIEVVGIDIKAALYNDVIDVKAINALNKKKYDLKRQKADYIVESFAKLKGILSDDQKAKLKVFYKAKKMEKSSKGFCGKCQKGSQCPFANKGSNKGSMK